ncbi:hypothetical protein CVT24_003848 [Panaeolus cyanescens]|uniref:Transmembrane protein n=1 Tax=Panaeolus cyanescens TaxID=181874 RepID=A0A409WND6_9AGAR|nr:hypothetical protein CVT24_003848 [Panaeolus cyanescens]
MSKSGAYAYTPIVVQPNAKTQLPMSPSLDSLNKIEHDAEAPYTHMQGHRRCHTSTLRRIVLPVAALIVGFLIIAGAGCAMGGMSMMGSSTEMGDADVKSTGEGGWNLVSIFGRAVADGANGNDNTFVNRKLYLIIIFVGLVLVVIAGIMLSAWCCKGVFILIRIWAESHVLSCCSKVLSRTLCVALAIFAPAAVVLHVWSALDVDYVQKV